MNSRSGEGEASRSIDLDRWRSQIEEFESALFAGKSPRIEDVPPPEDAHCEPLLEELMHLEIEYRGKRGEPFALTEYVHRFPLIARDPQSLARLQETYARFVRPPVPGSRPILDAPPPPASGARRADSAMAGRHLLFGIIALQNNFITREQLVAAFDVWVKDKSRDLGQILVAASALTSDEYELLSRLVAKFLEKHGGDAERSLAALSSVPQVRPDLERVADADLIASLRHVGQAVEDDAGQQTLFYNHQDLAGRFRILRPHAKGGLGQVSVALDLELNREVALKEILLQHSGDTTARERFLLEAEITGGLEHPGIVPVYALGRSSDGRPFYAMRFVKGDSLKQAIEQFHKADNPNRQDSGARQLELRQLLGRFVDVCNAIEYAHSRGVLHRDLKPGNIMVGKYGETLVVDWGLAKALGKREVASDDTTLRPTSALSSSVQTQPGSAIGTPAYMSPEQAAGKLDELGAATDVYSLGATLYHLLCGRPPFDKSDLKEILQKVQKGEFPRPRSVISQTSLSLEAICLKAMELQPKDRYLTARELADDIEHWLADEPVAVLSETISDRLARIGRKHRSVVISILAASTLIAIVSTVAALVVNHQRQENADLALHEREEKQRAEKLANEKAALANDKSALAQANIKLAEIATQNEKLAIDRADKLRVKSEDLRRELYISRLARAGAALLANDHLSAESALESIPFEQRGWEFHLLWRRFEGTPLTLHATTNVCFSPDGRHFATTCDWIPGIVFRDPGTGHKRPPFFEPDGPNGYVGSMAFDQDGNRLAYSTFDGSAHIIKIRDTRTGKLLVTLRGHTGHIRSLCFSPDGMQLASTSQDNTARLWDATTFDELYSFPHDGASSVSFSPDGQRLATSGQVSIKLWNTVTGAPLQTFTGLAGWVECARFSPDGLLIAGTSSTAIRLFNAQTGTVLQTLHSDNRFDNSLFGSLSFSPDGRHLASGGTDQTITIWDVKTAAQLQTFRGHTGGRAGHSVGPLNFTPDGLRLASSSYRETTKVWDTHWTEGMQTLHGHAKSVQSVVFSSDGKRMASVSFDDTVKVWEILTGTELLTLPARNQRFASFSPDGKVLATYANQGMTLYDSYSGAKMPMLDGQMSLIDICPDWTRLATLSQETITIRDFKTGSILQSFQHGHPNSVSLCFSPDGKYFVSGGRDGTIRLWNPLTGKVVRELSVGHSPYRIAIAQDGALLATSDGGDAIQLWSLRSGARVTVLHGHTRSVISMAFSPNGHLIASGSSDKTLRIWDTQTGDELLSIRNQSEVRALSFSPDGSRLAVALDDASIKLLDGRWATEFQSLRGREEDLISTIKFSRDGQYVVAYSYKGNAMTWRIADGELVPAEAIPNITDLMDVSPDPQLSATPRGNDIQLIRRNPDYDPWAEDAERRRRLSEKWHSDGATAAEASQNWFAAAFHLGWLLRNQSGDTDLKTRYTESVAKLKKQNMTPPRLPPAAEPLAEEK